MQMSENKKIFQPKVIIGSILGFVSAAVGVVAVFFPSLLNLERERMPKYEVAMDYERELNREYYDKFIEFLEERIKDKKVFELNLQYTYPGAGAALNDFLSLLNDNIAFGQRTNYESKAVEYECVIAGLKDSEYNEVLKRPPGAGGIPAQIQNSLTPENFKFKRDKVTEVDENGDPVDIEDGMPVSDVRHLDTMYATEYCFPIELVAYDEEAVLGVSDVDEAAEFMPPPLLKGYAYYGGKLDYTPGMANRAIFFEAIDKNIVKLKKY